MIPDAEKRALMATLQQGLARGVSHGEIVETLYSMFKRWHTASTAARVPGGRLVSNRFPDWCRDMGNGVVKCKRCGWRGAKPGHFTGFKCKGCRAPWWDNALVAEGGRIIDGLRYTAAEIGPEGTPLVWKKEAD